jgi:hypothetical protein
MKREMFLAGLLFAAAVPAFSDVTIKQTTSGKAMGVATAATTTTYIKGAKMRTELDVKGTQKITIFDVDAQKMYSFDSKTKNVDVWDMQAFSAEMAKNVDASEIKASIKANGQTKDIGGKTANGYDMLVTVPTVMGGQGGMEMTVKLTGPIWIVKGAPGTQDYVNFYKSAVEKGWIFSDPRAAKGSPGQAKAMAEMQRQLAATNGVPYEMNMNIAMEGEGPMAAMMAKMGGMTMTSTVSSVDTGALDDALFAPPAGSKLNPKK